MKTYHLEWNFINNTPMTMKEFSNRADAIEFVTANNLTKWRIVELVCGQVFSVSGTFFKIDTIF